MPSAAPRHRRRITGLAAITLALGVLALTTPLGDSEYPASRIGALLALAAIIEALHALRRSTAAARRKATVSAVISMAIALFLINAPLVAASGAAAGDRRAGLPIDAVRYAIARAFAATIGSSARLPGWRRSATRAVVLLILLAHGWLSTMGVALAGALRIFGIAWNIIVAPVFTSAEADADRRSASSGWRDNPGAVAMAAEIEAAERTRAPIDRGWTLSFIATLFAIHIGRMSTDFTLLGLLSPAVAVAGDMLIAVLITLLVINPTYLCRGEGPRAGSSGGCGAGTSIAATLERGWIDRAHRRRGFGGG